MCNSHYVKLGKNNFSIIQNLQKIDFEDSRSAKSTTLTQLEALNFDSFEFLHFLKADFHQINQFQNSLKNYKKQQFQNF